MTSQNDLSPADLGHQGLPHAQNEKVKFDAPWQAQVWVMARALIDAGLISPDEWAQELGSQISRAQAHGDPDTGETYYEHYLRALELIVAHKRLTSTAELTSFYDAWARAASRTPHGKPIELRTGDFSAS